MTTGSSSIPTMTQTLVEGNTIALIWFALPSSVILTKDTLNEEDRRLLVQLIGRPIEQWLSSYATSRNLDLKLPTSLGICATSGKALQEKIQQDWEAQQEEKERRLWHRFKG